MKNRHISIEFQEVSFSYETAAAALLERVTVHLTSGWTGIVGPNGAGKTTLLKLATQLLLPQQGNIMAPYDSIYCPQRTDDAPDNFAELIESNDGEACEIRGRLCVAGDWLERWHTLSHGERKRAQLATALWLRPPALAIDEPTNHLDADARHMLKDALRFFKGIGLLVSHDRELIDSLCTQCLFLDPPYVTMRPGTYTEGTRQTMLEQDAAFKKRTQARRKVKRIEREFQRRSEEASRAARKRSKRSLSRKDHDAKEKIDMARVSGKDGKAGRLKTQMAGRVRQAHQGLEGLEVRKTYDLGIWLPDSRSRRDHLLRLPAGSLPLGEGRNMSFPDLLMATDARIALTGPNGTGKSTLIRELLPHLNVPDERMVYLPQEIDLAASQGIMDHARRLPHDVLGHMMTVVSRLGSRPARLLESHEPSPGEIRKVLLAIGIAQSPHIIVMDEPTNHLDLPSIECLEAALSDCPCGLLLVSHDHRFLRRLTHQRWHITHDSKSQHMCKLRLSESVEQLEFTKKAD